jgi:pyroglutamyl-peptidase
MTKKILITGFPPFHTHKMNPTESVFKYLSYDSSKYKLENLILPVDFEHCFTLLEKRLINDPPDFLFMLGLAANRSELSLERISINFLHSDRKDNLGKIKQNEKINKNGKDAYFSTLPLEKMATELLNNKIPFHFSNTAGTYVCNMIFYQALEFIELNHLQTKAGFIHVPPTAELVASSRLNVEELAQELSIMIQALD